MASSTIHINMNDLINKSKEGKTILFIIMFKAEWCAPCKQLMPKFIEFTNEYPSVKFYSFNIDDDNHKDIVDYFMPSKVPSFYLFKNNQILNNMNGTNLNTLGDMIEEFL